MWPLLSHKSATPDQRQNQPACTCKQTLQTTLSTFPCFCIGSLYLAPLLQVKFAVIKHLWEGRVKAQRVKALQALIQLHDNANEQG